jgi:CRISPR/Cas system-associated exonuclease Cas4 (RecB family)
MRTIRVSEISSFVYCSRAWWYQNQGIQSQNQDELAYGNLIHQKHGRSLFVSGCLRLLAYLLILTALVLFTVHFISLIAQA